MRVIMWILCFVFIFGFCDNLYSQENYSIEELLDMSLEELLNLKIRTGTLIDIKGSELPVALTIITKQDIQLTPARNLLDLLEIYVPGFTYVEHFMGPRMGLRGILGDQNYSFLLLVNGRNENIKYSHGPFFELLNKDLSEIHKIEVIRGPGSVTYGSGAIAGIINIITINNYENDLNQLSYSQNRLYNFDKYSFESQYKDNNFESCLNYSQARSKGNPDIKFWYIDRAHGYGYGFMNPSWGNMEKGSLAPPLYADYKDQPETKMQYYAIYKENYELLARYTSTSQNYTTQSNTLFNDDIWNGISGKHANIELKHHYSFSDILSYKSLLSFGSADICEYRYWRGEDANLEDITQKGLSFSENEYNYNIQFNLEPSKKINLAFGAEYNYEFYAPQWGKEDNTFLMSFQPPIHFAVIDSSSGFYRYFHDLGFATLIDDDISCNTISVFGEGYLDLHPKLKVMFSGRYDKHNLADPAISPRIALISALNENNVMKLTLQKSVRIPLFGDLYSQDYLETGKSEFEELRGMELSYQRLQNQNLSIGMNIYYNEIDQFAWIPETEASGLAGNLDLMGLEMELQYKTNKNLAGMNYSYVKQLNWESSFNDTAWITGLEGEIIYLDDNASDRLNNFPSHNLKFFWNRNLTDNLRLHLDGRFAFDYQQSIMLDKFKAAHEEYGNPVTIDEMNDIIDALENHGYAKPSFTSDISLSWKKELSDLSFTTTIFARNVISYNHVRYIIQYWENDNLRQYPRQCGFIEEPLDIGIEITCNF